MTQPLRRVLVAHARDCFRSQQWLTAHWKTFNFLFEPDFEAACRESDRFIGILEDFGAEVDVLPEACCPGLDSLYVHDPIIAAGPGLMQAVMGKEARKPEPAAVAECLRGLGLSVSEIDDPDALIEGGDVVWLRSDLPAVGIGFRTNHAGADALEALCGNTIQELIRVSLPWDNGPSDVLHVMSLVSPLSADTLLIHSRRMPVEFRQRLLIEGFRLIEVPEEEYETLGGNVLALDDNTCLIEMGNTQTIRLLSDAGFQVLTYDGRSISLAGSGGPTCLTRPLLRG